MEAILGRCKSEFALSAVNALVGWRQESPGVYLPLKTHFSGCHSENMGRRPLFRSLYNVGVLEPGDSVGCLKINS